MEVFFGVYLSACIASVDVFATYRARNKFIVHSRKLEIYGRHYMKASILDFST